MPDGKSDKEHGNSDKEIYQELCASFRGIDEFRTKLFGALPLASGVGIFLLIGETLADEHKRELVTPFFLPIGLFGFVVTLGLFVYELHAIDKCERLIKLGVQIEGDREGQFKSYRGLGDFFGKPLAAFLIYPAVLASWAFVALNFTFLQQAVWCFSILVFVLSFTGGSMFHFRQLRKIWGPRVKGNRRALPFE